MRKVIGWACSALLLTACGGGGGGDISPITPAGWVSGVFQPASNFAARCAAPRMGTDPATGAPYPDKVGSTLDENNWLRSWTNDLYLWFDEVTDQNPALFSTTAAYFPVLKTTATTASGAAEGQVSLHLRDLGVGSAVAIRRAGGLRRAVGDHLRRAAAPGGGGLHRAGIAGRRAAANLTRGAEVLKVDGVDLVNDNTQAGIDALNAGLFPAAAGETHTFEIRDLDAAHTIRDITMVSADVTSHPVQNVEHHRDLDRAGRLHAVQRSPRDRRGGAGQRVHHAQVRPE